MQKIYHTTIWLFVEILYICRQIINNKLIYANKSRQ